jgi:hypothetical protein
MSTWFLKNIYKNTLSHVSTRAAVFCLKIRTEREMTSRKRRRDSDGLVLLANHPSFCAISLWYFTIHRPRLEDAMKSLRSAASVALFITKLRWQTAMRMMKALFMMDVLD